MPKADELSKERAQAILSNGVQQSFPLLAVGYREPSLESPSYPFKPLCDEDHTTP